MAEKILFVAPRMIGDAVMAEFGVPYPFPDHAHRALSAAVKIRGVAAEHQGELSDRHLGHTARQGTVDPAQALPLGLGGERPGGLRVDRGHVDDQRSGRGARRDPALSEYRLPHDRRGIEAEDHHVGHCRSLGRACCPGCAQRTERRPQGEAHSKPADQQSRPRPPREPLADQSGERLLPSSKAGAHQRVGAQHDPIILAASDQPKLAAAAGDKSAVDK